MTRSAVGPHVRSAALGGLHRLAQRVAWEAYNARVDLRRWVLDRTFSPRRRRQLLSQSARFGIGADKVLTLPAPVGIEPRFGYLVKGRSAVIEEALMGSECARLRGERYAFSGVPTLRGIRADRRRGRELAGPIISLRHTFGSNYYHAVVDCMGALALLDEQESLADVPIVIGPDLRSTKVMRAVVDSGLVDERRLIVQEDDWIGSAQSVTFARFDPLAAAALRRTSCFLARAVTSSQPSQSSPMLYVARGAHGVGRTLRNEAELIAELERCGFDVVDPGTMSWEEQYALFRMATHVVGVHGAALTNILFRAPLKLDVVEITPPDNRAQVFRTMATALDYSFRRVNGTDRSSGGTRPSFVVDVGEVMRQLRT